MAFASAAGRAVAGMFACCFWIWAIRSALVVAGRLAMTVKGGGSVQAGLGVAAITWQFEQIWSASFWPAAMSFGTGSAKATIGTMARQATATTTDNGREPAVPSMTGPFSPQALPCVLFRIDALTWIILPSRSRRALRRI